MDSATFYLQIEISIFKYDRMNIRLSIFCHVQNDPS